jgi:hypothetical protein
VNGDYDECRGTVRLRYIEADTYGYRNMPSAVLVISRIPHPMGRFAKVKPYYSYVCVI